MKHLLIAGIIAASSTAALAQPFEFQRQIGSTEYVLTEDTEHLTFAPVTRSRGVDSLTTWMVEADVDGIAANDYRGNIVKSGPSRISLYEIQRGSPETAYRDYHERYPENTDWEAVARNYRNQQLDEGLASDSKLKEGDS